jgi:hypothetical protein
MIKYFIGYWCDSDPLKGLLSVFLVCQHLNLETNLRESENKSWFKVKAAPVFSFDRCKVFLHTP